MVAVRWLVASSVGVKNCEVTGSMTVASGVRGRKLPQSSPSCDPASSFWEVALVQWSAFS